MTEHPHMQPGVKKNAGRQSLITKIHVARKDLALEVETYRDILGRVTGHTSCAACSIGQLEDVLKEMKRLGFRVKAGRRRVETSAAVRKVWAIWREMAPALRSEGSEAALRAFVKRTAGVDAPEFLDDEGAQKVIEALKAWRVRLAAGVSSARRKINTESV
ncbi:DUF1018 domain-containing protein [Acetobacter sp. LMG 1637]|uniref:DUF1018 domain-containing protein n=1 Tax=Acetobacter fallax TaxID=1737473 RepID=A0ABX0KBZ3_9PROT|nr:DUF1018 domain-containing protein [Acetobacter fallax]